MFAFCFATETKFLFCLSLSKPFIVPGADSRMHRAGRPVSAKPHSHDARTTGDMSDTKSMDGG